MWLWVCLQASSRVSRSGHRQSTMTLSSHFPVRHRSAPVSPGRQLPHISSISVLRTRSRGYIHTRTVEDSITVGMSYQNIGTRWKLHIPVSTLDQHGAHVLPETVDTQLPQYFRIGLSYALELRPPAEGKLHRLPHCSQANSGVCRLRSLRPTTSLRPGRARTPRLRTGESVLSSHCSNISPSAAARHSGRIPTSKERGTGPHSGTGRRFICRSRSSVSTFRY